MKVYVRYPVVYSHTLPFPHTGKHDENYMPVSFCALSESVHLGPWNHCYPSHQFTVLNS